MKTIKNIFSRLDKALKNQINDYKKLKFIRKGKSKLRTVISTILYLISMLALVPSVIELVLDSLIHITTTSFSMLFYTLSIKVA